jgi:hypothetical protein
MRIRVELSENDLKNLIIKELNKRYGDEFDPRSLKIEVKSTQNYKSEWEQANYRAIYESWEE